MDSLASNYEQVTCSFKKHFIEIKSKCNTISLTKINLLTGYLKNACLSLKQQKIIQAFHQITLSRNCLFLFIFCMNIYFINCKQHTLYTAGFFPLSGDKSDIGLGILPAVQLALDDISDKNVIPGYKLDLVGNDTMCDAAVGMKTFFDMIFAAPKKLILFGDACTSVTDPIARASRFFHLIQLSYADTHPMYTSDSYPNLFRLAPSQSAFNKARVALLKKFYWKRVGTIYENSPRYSLSHSRLLTELDQANISIASTQSISEEVQYELTKIKEKDVRIILGNFGESCARKIFCQAYKHGIYGRKYQWIIAGEYNEFWWTKEEAGINCTKRQLLQAIDGYIVTDVLQLSTDNVITASGMTAAEYEEKYNYLRNEDFSKFHGYAYDGLWTIALAIQRVQRHLQETYSNITLQHFQYRDPFWSKLFRDAVNKIFFMGVTGNVSFANNERKGSIVLKQLQGNREVKIGEYHSTLDLLNLTNNPPISWKSSLIPPLDRTVHEIVASRVNLTLFIIVSVFSILGIILAFVFLFMNIKYRKQRYIKMSSPYLNNLIIIGCVFTYISVILLGLDSRLLNEANFPQICAARAWVLMTGFTLAFGSMFSKTWRVHAIFTNIKLNKKVIKDYKLFMVVGVLVFIDVATLTTWQIIDPFYRETTLGIPETMLENEDILIVPQMEYCQSKRMTIFLGSIYIYKGLLMTFGIFLVWETRHVSIPALNDSKHIGMSVYNVVIMCVIGAGLSVMLKDQQNAAFLFISIFIIFCSTATLCLVFVPKVRMLIELKRNPNLEKKRVRPTLKPFKKSRQDSDDLELHNKIKTLNDTNIQQRQRLKEKTYELESLMFRLKKIKSELCEQNDFCSNSSNNIKIENFEQNSLKLTKKKKTKKPITMKQIDIVIGDESFSKSKNKDISFLSMSASFLSFNDNLKLYSKSHNQTSDTKNNAHFFKNVNKKLIDQVLLDYNFISESNKLRNKFDSENQCNSCPDLFQNYYVSNNLQYNHNYLEKLIMPNTITKPYFIQNLNCLNNEIRNQNSHKIIENKFQVRKLMKSISETEPLYLIEKILKMRFDVRKFLNNKKNNFQSPNFCSNKQSYANKTTESPINENILLNCNHNNKLYKKYNPANTFNNYPKDENIKTNNFYKQYIKEKNNLFCKKLPTLSHRQSFSLNALESNVQDYTCKSQNLSQNQLFFKLNNEEITNRLSSNQVTLSMISYTPRSNVNPLLFAANNLTNFSSSPTIKCDIIEYL